MSYAIKSEHIDIVQHLLNKGAKIDVNENISKMTINFLWEKFTIIIIKVWESWDN